MSYILFFSETDVQNCIDMDFSQEEIKTVRREELKTPMLNDSDDEGVNPNLSSLKKGNESDLHNLFPEFTFRKTDKGSPALAMKMKKWLKSCLRESFYLLFFTYYDV